MPMEQERKIKTIIDCVNVGKVFQTPEGEHEVVRNLNFSAEENEFLVLFGPGQCGKTTIINMIAGFESATTGKMLADGEMKTQVLEILSYEEEEGEHGRIVD